MKYDRYARLGDTGLVGDTWLGASVRNVGLYRWTGRLAAGMALSMAVAASAAHAGFLDGKTYDNVVVDGTAYNVSFENGTYVDVYASTPPAFLNNEPGAHDAIIALRALFLLAPHNTGGSVNNYDAAWVPYADSSGTFTGYITDNVPFSQSMTPPYSSQTGSDTDDFTPFLELFSIFTPVNPTPPANPPPGNLGPNGAPLPEPATWAMMILGVAMVGYALRRRLVAVAA